MIPNLRDVGEAVNCLSGRELMREGVLFRGGTVNELFSVSELPPVDCILNLRSGPDHVFVGKKQLHIPAVDSVENYVTASGAVRNWLNRVLAAICADVAFPLLIHCTAGKDRTGVVVALILALIDVPQDVIVEEYLLSDGVADSANIETALQGIGRASDYVYSPDVSAFLKQALLI
ncbi:tyrosine-protein phosphatase [Hahella sp. HN01]|uniref:tyrosine-protein phosphatase n=1 Tax=Hahella sp. HN01 TaxID=2847262 RepID=UPI001C1EE1CD|nr:tyrosine-protein phosphatase [Hahella sp. HN01]